MEAASSAEETSESSTSMKGLKAVSSLVISGGAFTIDAADDAVHSNAGMTVSGGTIDISESYEGLEALHLDIQGGEISLVSRDDGLNAAGGTDGSGSTGGRDGRFGGWMGGAPDGEAPAGPGEAPERSDAAPRNGRAPAGRIGRVRRAPGDAGGRRARRPRRHGRRLLLRFLGGQHRHLRRHADHPGLGRRPGRQRHDRDHGRDDRGGGAHVRGHRRAGLRHLRDHRGRHVPRHGRRGHGADVPLAEQGVVTERVSGRGDEIVLADASGTALLTLSPALDFQFIVLSSPDLVSGETYTLTVGGTSTEGRRADAAKKRSAASADARRRRSSFRPTAYFFSAQFWLSAWSAAMCA